MLLTSEAQVHCDVTRETAREWNEKREEGFEGNLYAAFLNALQCGTARKCCNHPYLLVKDFGADN
jgi:hypothetical protein